MIAMSSSHSGLVPADSGVGDSRFHTSARALMSPGVIAISEDASLLQAQRVMLRHQVHAVLVLGRRSGRPVGWVTSRGVLGRLAEDPGLVTAGSAVTEPPLYVEPSASAVDALQMLSQPNVSHLLVARHSDEPPQGVISDLDLIALVVDGT